jgi:hypothetical protein
MELHGVFTKKLVESFECRGVLDLHTRDSTGKALLNYAEEEANRDFPEDIFSECHPPREESYKSLKTMSHILL